MALDERLRREIERAGEPADPSGVYEDLIRRRERRRLTRRVEVSALSLVVLAGCVAGVAVLSRVFGQTESQLGAGGGEGILFEDRVGDQYAVYVVQPDGSGLTRLTDAGEAGDASWSPDGSRIVFSRFDLATRTADLFLMSPDGSDVTRLTDTPQVSENRGRWSPDGTRIAFEAETENGPLGVYVMNADGSDVQRLTDASSAAGAPDWSPDGSQLVFNQTPHSISGTGGTEIWIMDADGGDAHFVTGDQGDLGEASANFGPRWSPDGDSIVFTHERDIYVVNVDGTGLTNLTPESRTDVYDRDPAWSSDGRRIVFASTRTHGDSQSLFTMNADGSDVRPVLAQSIGFCCPEPDWRGDATSASPSASQDPTPTETPPPPGQDLGLGFPVCNVSSIKGPFASPDANATLSVATRSRGVGGCPPPEDAFNLVALDTDQDGVAEASYGPIECTLECRAFASPDVDGDGTDEALVVQDGGAVVGLRLYDVVATGEVAIVPVNVAEPGDPMSLLVPGEQATFLLGGDAFELYALRCGSLLEPQGPGVIATGAEARPHDSLEADWHAHQVTVVLGSGGLLHVVDVRDFTEPVSTGGDAPSFGSDETLCGSRLGPPVPTP